MIFANTAHSVAFPTLAYRAVFDLLSLLGFMLVCLWSDFLVFFFISFFWGGGGGGGKGTGKVEPFPFYFSFDSFDN